MFSQWSPMSVQRQKLVYVPYCLFYHISKLWTHPFRRFFFVFQKWFEATMILLRLTVLIKFRWPDLVRTHQLYLCLQETLRRHPDRKIWVSITSWDPYIQSNIFFSITSVWQLTSFEIQTKMKILICLTFIGFPRITINTELLRLHPSVPSSLYPFY